MERIVNKTLKKICGTICAVAMSASVLVGCNLVTQNTAKYYNQVVIEVGDSVKYTKKDLIDAFYNYSYQYVQAGQMDAKAGVERAASVLVERGLLIDELKATYFAEGGEIGPLTDNDYKSIRKSAWESMQSQIDSYESEIREARGITQEEYDEDEAQEELLRDEYEPYQAKVIYVDGHFVYNDELEDDEDLSQLSIPEHFEQTITDADISRVAWLKYVAALQATAKAEGKSTNEQDVVAREEARLLKVYEDNMYITKFKEYYELHNHFNHEIEIDDKTYQELSSYEQENAVKYYKSLYESQKEKYTLDIDSYYEAMKDTSTSGEVVYHPVEGKFMNVSHILLSFSDTQKAEVKKLQNQKKTDPTMTDEAYQLALEQIAQQTVVKYNDVDGDGKVIVVQKSAQEVYEMIVNYVTAVSDATLRAQRFNEMIYKFNDDPGIMNKEFDYVVDLDDSIYATEENPTNNIMVREFTLAARALYDTTDELYGAGNISELVITDYGYHIIINTGAVKNIASDVNSINANLLNAAKTHLGGNQTWFQHCYDKVVSDNYDTFVTDLVSRIKGTITIVYYEYRYKDLWN